MSTDRSIDGDTVPASRVTFGESLDDAGHEEEGELIYIADNEASEEDSSIMEDFVSSMGSRISRPSFKKSDSVAFVLDSITNSVKEESSTSVESAVIVLDRAPYIHKFLKTMPEYGLVKRLNNFLHKKMADYFRKRKMEHVLLEVSQIDDQQARYSRKLAAFTVRRDRDGQMRKSVTEELADMKELRNQQCREAETNFHRLVDRETEIGVGLIVTKTGKVVQEKVIEKLIQNQVSKAKELQSLRLLHIKIRNAIADITAAIRALDHVGEGHTLAEYEQLKIEHHGYVDKIEERDDEMSRLRRNCRSSIQLLAHIKEKCAASEQNIRGIRLMLDERQMQRKGVREEVNRLKQERDWYRSETLRLKQASGLLTNDKLLIDMEDAIKSIETLAELNRTKRDNLATERERVCNLKQHHENEMRKRGARKQNTALTARRKPTEISLCN